MEQAETYVTQRAKNCMHVSKFFSAAFCIFYANLLELLKSNF